MFKKTDPYSFSIFSSLLVENNKIGLLTTEYQVSHYDDVQLMDTTSIIASNTSRKYLINCTQKINIFNKNGLTLSPTSSTAGYLNYPVLLSCKVSIDNSNDEGLTFQLLEYSPQTVNTKIQSAGSVNDSTGATSSTSLSNTVGSSTSETNSFGVSVTVGATEVNDSASANYEHSATSTSDESTTKGTDSGRSRSKDVSSSASMSMKDWGSYALVEPVAKQVVWTFGQEYPWDAIESRTSGGTTTGPQTIIALSPAIKARLYDTVSEVLYPASQLSMFGINFVVKSFWLAEVADNASDVLTVTTAIDYVSGSHDIDPVNGFQVTMDSSVTELSSDNQLAMATPLDLALMALDPIGSQSANAIIGFVPNKFTVKPGPGKPFKIVSGSNDLLIRDTTVYGTSPDTDNYFSSAQTALTANLSPGSAGLNLTLFFKVINAVDDYTLFIKHWKTEGASAIMLTLTFNGDTSTSIVKYVDATEAEGGENNLTSISLRNLSYASVDFHDYLRLGLNSIEITAQSPVSTSISGGGYQIRAISIERS